MLAEHPVVLRNVALTLIERQKLANEQILLRQERGEAVALVIGKRTADLVDQGIAAAERASPHPVAVIDLTGKVEVEPLDCGAMPRRRAGRPRPDAGGASHRDRHGRSPATRSARSPRELDRAVYLLAEAEARGLGTCIELAHVAPAWILVGRHESAARRSLTPLRAISLPASERDRRWLGRHLSRTKLGLALGAGGAKSYAHVGALQVLEDAGYEVDCVTGISFGAIAGSCIAMGMYASQLRAQLDHLLSLDVCGAYFRLVTATKVDGSQVFYRALAELAGKRTFASLSIPLGILTADLNAQLPHAFVKGL